MTRTTGRRGLVAALLVLLLVPAVRAQERTIDAASLPHVKLVTPPVHGGFTAFALDPKGRTVVGGVGVIENLGRMEGGDILLWNPRTGKITKELGKHEATPTWVSFGPQGKTIISFSSDDHVLQTWKTSGKKPKATLTLGGPAYDDRPPQLSPDGKLVVHAVQLPQITRSTLSAVVGDLEVWDLAKKKLRWKLPASYAEAFAISPDSKLVAAWRDEVHWDTGKMKHVRSELVLLDAADGTRLWEAPTGRLKIRHLLFLPNGETILGISHRDMHRFQAADGAPIVPPFSLDSENYARRVALSPDGATLLVFRSMGEAVDFYDVDSGTHEVRVDFTGIDGLADPWFAPDRRAIVGKLGWDPAVIELDDAWK